MKKTVISRILIWENRAAISACECQTTEYEIKSEGRNCMIAEIE